MATNTLDPNLTAPAETAEAAQPRRPGRLARLARTFTFGLPLLLFGLAILLAPGFYFAGQPLLGAVSLGVALAAGLLSVVMAAFLPGG